MRSSFIVAAVVGSASFDHLVGKREKRRRDRQPERLGGLQIDDELELDRRLDRQIGRLLARENGGQSPNYEMGWYSILTWTECSRLASEMPWKSEKVSAQVNHMNHFHGGEFMRAKPTVDFTGACRQREASRSAVRREHQSDIRRLRAPCGTSALTSSALALSEATKI